MGLFAYTLATVGPLAVFLTIVLIANREIPALGWWTDLPTLLFAVFAPLAAVWMTFGKAIRPVIVALSRKRFDDSTARLAVLILDRWRTFTLAAGVLSTLIGIVAMLRGLGTLSLLASFEHGISIAVLPLAWAVFLSFVVMTPVQMGIQRRIG